MVKNLRMRADLVGIAVGLPIAAAVAVSGILGQIPDAREYTGTVSDEVALIEVFSPVGESQAIPVFGDLCAPLTGRTTSAYGYRTDPFSGDISFHRGIDIAAECGTDVRACATGTVIEASYDPIGGNHVTIRHENGTESYYGHLQVATVSRGDFVERGEVIGMSGQTGRVTGPHLHFQLTVRGRTVDPARYVDTESE